MGQLRSAHPTYLRLVRRFWAELFEQLRPHMLHSGGPILMVQLENEFGTWNAAGDTSYLRVRSCPATGSDAHATF